MRWVDMGSVSDEIETCCQVVYGYDKLGKCSLLIERIDESEYFVLAAQFQMCEDCDDI